jgi:glycosyltransferase involved in cell wall biosynthesis
VKVSIVIPAFNEEKLIARTVANIQSATSPFTALGWKTELIVCDNNSTDRTAELACEAGATVVFESVNQIARARNRGAAAATGDWLIFVDADSWPSAELFADVAAEIESGRCIAGGSTVTLDKHYPIASFVTTLWNRLSRTATLMAGSFIFCEAVAFREIGGFSAELFASEEIELSKRLKKLGRCKGKKVIILHKHPMLTSSRKMRLYSRRDYFRFFVRNVLSLGKGLKSRNECFPWYDGRR